MSELMILPSDLNDDEREYVEALVRPVEERAALAVRVRREVLRLCALGHGPSVACEIVGDDKRFPVSAGTAIDIWYRRRAWSAD